MKTPLAARLTLQVPSHSAGFVDRGGSERQAEDAGVAQLVAAVTVHLTRTSAIGVRRQVDALGELLAARLLCHVHQPAGDALPAVVLVDDDILDPVLLTDQDDHRCQKHRTDDLAVVDGDEQAGVVVEHVVQPLVGARHRTRRELRKEAVDVNQKLRRHHALQQLHVAKLCHVFASQYERLKETLGLSLQIVR